MISVGKVIVSSPELVSQPNPADALAQVIAQRHKELTTLSNDFSFALELADDTPRINEVLATSVRPDLVMREPVAIMPVNSLDDMRSINNFYPNMGGFGMRVFGPPETLPSGRVLRPALGRRQPNEEEVGRYFLMGARGNYEDHLAFAEAHGVDKDEARDMLLQSHVDKESFMRMWILFPNLTRTLMTRCLNEDRNKTKFTREEVFVAYNLMARLVDKNDKYVMDENGEIDTWALCH